MALTSFARSASVAFSWQENTEPDLAGYKLYYGPSSGAYTNHVRLGKVATYRMTNLVAGATYYFALTAFNTNDIESAFTPELRFPNAPVLAPIANRTIPEDSSATNVLQLSDVDSDVLNLTLSATSSNLTLVPISAITFSGTGSNRTMVIVPVPNQSGTSAITVTVSDGALSSSRTFLLTVSGTPDAPTISGINDVTTSEDVETGLISFTVNDLETPAGNLTVRATSSNTSLIPTNRIILGGSGASRTVRLRPTTNQSGSATITLTVSDGALSASTAFDFTVLPVNDSPVAGQIANLSLPEDTQSSLLAFTIGDVETAAADLQVTATSGNQGVVPNENIFLNGSGSNRTVRVRPATNAVGSASITLTVSDGQAVATESFTATFTAVNDVPFVSQPPDLVVNKFNPVPPIPVTLWDVETAVSALTVTLTSSNTALLPTATNMVLSGTGTNRTLTLIPIGIGMSRVGIQVRDGTATNRVFFLFTVTGSNNAPVLTVPGTIAGRAGAIIPVVGIECNDPDVKTNNMTFTIRASNGNLSVATSVAGGVRANQISGNNSGTVTINAPCAALNATFANPTGLTYVSQAAFRGNETLVVTVSDNGFTGAGGVKTDTENITIQVGGDTLDEWRAGYFSAADLQDPAKESTVWGELADPDNDGRHNLMEFALGLNPLGSEPQEAALLSQTASSGGNQYQTLTFHARLDEPSLQYIVEVSADNSAWAATAQRVSSNPVNAQFERVTYQDNVAITSQTGRFIRLRIVRNSP